MGLAFHEIYEVSDLSMGEIPYEEYVPIREKLHLLQVQDALVYNTY